MAITVTANLTDISDCDQTTGWDNAGGGTNSLNDPEVFGHVQGNYCIKNYKSSTGNRGGDFTWGTDQDFSAETVYAWFAFNNTGILQVKGSTGLRIRITDSSSNWEEWDIAGSDTLPHAGWICHALRTDQTASRNGGTAPTKTQIRKIGWRADSISAKGSVYWDAWRYGDGLTLDGGTSGTPADFDDFFTSDDSSTNKYGVITKLEGVYFVQGQLKIGKTDQTQITYFEDTNQTVVFKDVNVGNSFYSIVGQGAASYATTVKFGEKSGTAGVSGCLFNSAGSAKYAVTMTDANLTTLGLYGCTFQNFRDFDLPDYNANKETLGCNFVAGTEVDPGTGTMTDCKFLSTTSTTTGAIMLDDTTFKVTHCDFIDCSRGIRFPTGSQGSYDFDGINFVNCTYDIRNEVASAQVVTIGNDADSNANTHEEINGGTTTINSNVTLKITVVDESNAAIQNAQTSVFKTSDGSELMNEDTTALGVAEQTYNYPGSETDIYYRIRKASTGSTKYIPLSGTGICTADGFTAKVTLVEDTNA